MLYNASVKEKKRRKHTQEKKKNQMKVNVDQKASPLIESGDRTCLFNLFALR